VSRILHCLRHYAYLFLHEEPVRDHTPLCHSGDIGCERGHGRAYGRGSGRGLGIVGGRERPQDPPTLWSRNYISCADRPFGEQSPGTTQRYPNYCRAGLKVYLWLWEHLCDQV